MPRLYTRKRNGLWGGIGFLALPLLLGATNGFGQADVEEQGIVTINEQNLARAILNPDAFAPDELAALDVNGDGAVDAADLVQYLRSSRVVPIVSFAIPESGTDESRGVARVRAVFSASYKGALLYAVAGTAQAGEDFAPLSGTISLDGSYVDIPITILDDAVAEVPERITLSLVDSVDYDIGTLDHHTVTINDNEGTTPVAYFDVSSAAVGESDPSANVVLRLTRPSTGTVNYAVAGTADADRDFAPLSGSVPATAVRQTIPISLDEDDQFEGNEQIRLSLQVASGYRIGTPGEHVLTIHDNEHRWHGRLEAEESGHLGFVMEIVRGSGGLTTASLVGDGFGTVPEGRWVIHDFRLDADTLHATVEPFALPAALTRTQTAFTRTLQFSAAPGMKSYLFEPTVIRGECTEVLEPTAPSRQHLGRRMEGAFTIVRDAVLTVRQESTLVQVF